MAERLRALLDDDLDFDDPRSDVSLTEVEVALRLLGGFYDNSTKAKYVQHLADLIDRPTCHVVEHKTHCGSYGCEEAGQLWVLSCGDECVNDSDFPPSYCPECGAMVFEKEDER